MTRLLGVGVLVAFAAASCRSSGSAAPVLIQPGPPGQPTRPVSASEAAAATTRVSDADVQFMQEMLVHHAQAVEMTALLRSRTTREDMRLLAGRIEASQDDEMAFMRRWLEVRG